MNITLEIDDIVYGVDYDYQPKEEATLTYPGADEELTLNGAFVNDVDVFKSLPESTKNGISDMLWDLIYV